MMSAFSRWRRYSQSVRALSRLSDRTLDDIGIARDRIRDVSRLATAVEGDGMVVAGRHAARDVRDAGWSDVPAYAGLRA